MEAGVTEFLATDYRGGQRGGGAVRVLPRSWMVGSWWVGWSYESQMRG
jgi:hypothetical protein